MKITALEKKWFKMDRRTLYKTIFPNTFHYLSISIQKIQIFYEFILVDTGSIELTHNKDPTTKDVIYSEIKIFKVIILSEWERHPFHCKSFTRKFESPKITPIMIT
ncbi:hypothetical protein AHAS_Ahas06G0155400 [Arachis hypogaea]